MLQSSPKGFGAIALRKTILSGKSDRISKNSSWDMAIAIKMQIC